MSTPLNESQSKEGQIKDLFGECLHTAYRKGIDCDQAMPIHRLISQMPPGEWASYIDWVLWALRESGVTIKLDEP